MNGLSDRHPVLCWRKSRPGCLCAVHELWHCTWQPRVGASPHTEESGNCFHQCPYHSSTASITHSSQGPSLILACFGCQGA